MQNMSAVVVSTSTCSVEFRLKHCVKYDAIWKKISRLLEPFALTAWWLKALPMQPPSPAPGLPQPQTQNCTVAATAADAVVVATPTVADAVGAATPVDDAVAATAAAFPVPFTLFVPKLCIALSEMTTTAQKKPQSKFAQEYRWDSMRGVLGGGSFGVVRAATHISTDTKVAIKNYIGQSADPYFKETIEELSFYIHLGPHPHVVRPLDVATNNKGFGIVFERWDESLHTFLKQTTASATDADIMNEALRQMSSGLKFLHSKNVIHGDLKPTNILVHCPDRTNAPWTTPLSDNLKIVLADLGGCIWDVNRFATPAWQSFVEFHWSSYVSKDLCICPLCRCVALSGAEHRPC